MVVVLNAGKTECVMLGAGEVELELSEVEELVVMLLMDAVELVLEVEAVEDMRVDLVLAGNLLLVFVPCVGDC